ERYLALAQLLHVDRSAQPAADEAADLLLASAADAAIPGNALRTGWRNHRVLAGHPTLAAALQERGNLFLDRRATQHPGLTHADHARGGRGGEKARLDRDGPKLLGTSTVGASARLHQRHSRAD